VSGSHQQCPRKVGAQISELESPMAIEDQLHDAILQRPNPVLRVVRSRSGHAEDFGRSAPEPRPSRPAPHGIRRHFPARPTGREQPKRHNLIPGGTIRHARTLTLNQRVRGSSPWRRTIRTQVSKPLTCVFCVRLERFLQSRVCGGRDVSNEANLGMPTPLATPVRARLGMSSRMPRPWAPWICSASPCCAISCRRCSRRCLSAKPA